MNTQNLSVRTLAFATFSLVLSVAPPAWAQSVFKCTVDGKSSYQSTPCAGQGKELGIAPGPSEQQIQDAKGRADAEKARLAGQPNAALPKEPQNQPVAVKIDCASLNKERADAYGRRNATVAGNRRAEAAGRKRGEIVVKPDVIAAESKAVDQENESIRRIEGQMAKGGCTLT